MSVEANKELVRRVHAELESEGRLELADQFFAPDVRTGRSPERPPGPEGVRRHLAMLRAAFPDFQASLEEIVAEGDLVAVRLTMRGTHLGVFRGTPPTGRRVSWSGLVLRRIAGGQIVEQWSQFDTGALVRQITDPPADAIASGA